MPVALRCMNNLQKMNFPLWRTELFHSKPSYALFRELFCHQVLNNSRYITNSDPTLSSNPYCHHCWKNTLTTQTGSAKLLFKVNHSHLQTLLCHSSTTTRLLIHEFHPGMYLQVSIWRAESKIIPEGCPSLVWKTQ